MRSLVAWWLVPAVVTAGIIARTADKPAATPTAEIITGPYASLLAASDDLGPAHRDRVELTASLHESSSPEVLKEWARQRDLSVRWRSGDRWATLGGAPAAVGAALDVDIHDYRGRRGQVFYASPQQPSVPAPLRGEIVELGRILGYTPHRQARPSIGVDLPPVGQRPDTLLPNIYNAGALRKAGYTGKGQTVVIFAFDGFDQADLDSFSSRFGLPPLDPQIVGGMPSQRDGEATMDLELVHSLAPDAKKVLVNARSTVEGDRSYEKIATMMESADRDFPGAVWSFSIGWGCDKLITAADLAPVRSAAAAALSHGTTAFDASGDLAGLECKGGQDWSAPPSDNDIGLDAVASIPEMTNVGGTTLSTDSGGRWVAEQAWFDAPLSQGTGGGVSALFDRPAWQQGLPESKGRGKRLTPDVAAVADPHNGVEIVFNRQLMAGGGTSMSAPIWAGLAAVMNQYLIDHGGRQLGDLNPMIYEIAKDQRLSAFKPITLGGNAVEIAQPGYDLVTGLGSPDIEALTQSVLIQQRQRPWG